MSVRWKVQGKVQLKGRMMVFEKGPWKQQLKDERKG